MIPVVPMLILATLILLGGSFALQHEGDAGVCGPESASQPMQGECRSIHYGLVCSLGSSSNKAEALQYIETELPLLDADYGCLAVYSAETPVLCKENRIGGTSILLNVTLHSTCPSMKLDLSAPSTIYRAEKSPGEGKRMSRITFRTFKDENGKFEAMTLSDFPRFETHPWQWECDEYGCA